MKKKRIIEWWKLCLDCGIWEKGESEYLGFSHTYCSRCDSMHLKGGYVIRVEEKSE